MPAQSPLTQARSKRAAGEDLTATEQELLRASQQPYLARQVKLTLREAEREDYRAKAESCGMGLAPWLAMLVRQGAEGGLVPREHAQRVEQALAASQQEAEKLRRTSAELQLRLSDAQALVRDYQDRIAGMANKLTAQVMA